MSDNTHAIAAHLIKQGVEFTAGFIRNMNEVAEQQSAELAQLRAENERLRMALGKITDQFTLVCEVCDDGWYASDDADAINEAREALKEYDDERA